MEAIFKYLFQFDFFPSFVTKQFLIFYNENSSDGNAWREV